MSTALIEPFPLRGSVEAPPSKSELHRALIMASVAVGETVIEGFSACEDVGRTMDGLRELADFERDGRRLAVRSVALSPVRGAKKQLDCFTSRVLRPRNDVFTPTEPLVVECGDSATTLRFLVPVYAVLGLPVRFVCSERLALRPMHPFMELLPGLGARLVPCESGYVLSGKLRPGRCRLPGNVSSQFVSGLLHALALQVSPCAVRLTTPPESATYLELTRYIASRFGVYYAETAIDGLPEFSVKPQNYQGCTYRVGGDWSACAALLAAGAIAGDVHVHGLDATSAQGDRCISALLMGMGASGKGGHITAAPLHGTVIDARSCPDLVPSLAAAACLAEGETVIRGAARHADAEDGRLRLLAGVLTGLGGIVHATADGLRIIGQRSLSGGSADVSSDHRVAMAAAALASACTGRTLLHGSDSVKKSYPDFFADFARLGGRVTLSEG